MIRELIIKNRSYRRFQQAPVERETLRELVDLARLSASAANRQPLKYLLCCQPEKNELIFPCLSWAGDLKDWPGPAQGERPPAYIIVLGDTRVHSTFSCDHGIAAQSIMLGATERGLGGCIMSAIDRPRLSQSLNIPPHYQILLVLALGKPSETVVLETVGPDGDIKYWRSKDDVLHVPKRALDDIIVG